LNIKRFHIAFLLFISITTWLSSCKTKQICPAYQSAFYLDPKIAEEEFSPFDKDSMPKMEETVRKTDVLLVLRLGKKKINKRMAVIPMITIFPEQADSTLAMADSMSLDSTNTEEESEEVIDENLSQDSTENIEPEPEEEAPVSEDEELPKKEVQTPKPKKKQDLKDPELSDPTMKAEFEESFQESPGDEDLNTPLPEEPDPVLTEPKLKAKRKGPKKQDVPKKEDEPQAEEDKF
jgi:hypothetical protein